jgi:hypothetical protein
MAICFDFHICVVSNLEFDGDYGFVIIWQLKGGVPSGMGYELGWKVATKAYEGLTGSYGWNGRVDFGNSFVYKRNGYILRSLSPINCPR